MKDAARSIRDSADIVRVVGDYVQLKKSGASLKGLCPFHGEKTPSFNVHPERQFFHCFGCGAGGDVFKFVMLIEQVPFPDAMRIVAEKCGIPIPQASPASDRAARERDALIEIHERAAGFYQKRLGAEDAAPARRILEERGIQPEFTRKFGIGYAPSYGLLERLKPPDPTKTGLFMANDRGEHYDRFRRRLMFPIWNGRGQVIAFGGRVVGDGQPKYMNSSESPLYSKSHVLYGTHLARSEARTAGRIVVVEGYFDVLSLHQNGIRNVVASCGTSLTSHQTGILSRLAPEVVVNYDPDTAGQQAAKRSIELLLAQGMTVRILRLPGGLDPDDFIRREGADAYRTLLDAAPYFWEHLIADAGRREDLSRPEVKSRVIGEILAYARGIRDRIVQLEIARAVAQSFKVPDAVVVEQLRAGREARTPAATATRSSPRLSDAEKQILHAVVSDPSVAERLTEFVAHGFLAEVWSGRVLESLIRNPRGDVEQVVNALDDASLAQAIRAAMLESPGPVPAEMALVSMSRLYEQHLAREEQRLAEELRQYPGAAPTALLKRKMEIANQKVRLRPKP